MPLQKIHFFKRFPTAMDSGKMYIRHLFCYGQLRETNFKEMLTTVRKKSIQNIYSFTTRTSICFESSTKYVIGKRIVTEQN